ncbi:MAG: hypothetical protein KAI66_15045 [Lentisphaeria bacterium]|nr:hypothetical protein [Lentisphaeria bacterium]
MRDRPDLQDCAVHCCHCGIRFFTHPRNAGRQNLHCPFGCRQCNRRQLANKRSRRHYQTPKGRKNKERLNGKRSQFGDDHETPSPGDVDAPPSPAGQPASEKPSNTTSVIFSGAESVSESAAPHTIPEASCENASPSENTALPLEGLLLDESTLLNSRILPYVVMVASIIEGRTIGRDELVAALRKRMRQRSIGSQARREYVLRYLNQHPP